MTSTARSLHVGFIGLGDQGLPMAVAVAEAGFPLHVWARRPASLERLGATPATTHDTLRELAAACDVVALCVPGDDDVLGLLSGGLLAGLRPGAVVVNHGTGTPVGAVRIAEVCARAGALALDAPVSGGRPAAQARALTTLVGGPAQALERCAPVLAAFSAHVVPLGDAGAGQSAKLFNNALLILNQAALAEVVELAAASGTDPDRLVQALRLGSACSRALTLLGEMVTPDTVEHLSAVEDLDVDLFATAMAEAGLDAGAVVARAHTGARGLPALVGRLPRTATGPPEKRLGGRAGGPGGGPAEQDPVVAVTALLLRERQSRDRARWEEMADCYTPDATIAMSWYHGQVAAFIERSRSMDVGGSHGVHRLSPPVVRVRGDRALAELPLVIEFRTDVDGVEADLCSFARSQYRAVREGGTWRIRATTSVYERDTLTPAVPGTALPVTADAFAGLRPSYRALAWHLGRNGYPVPGDLPGDDRPEAVSALLTADLAWLHEDPRPARPRHT